MACVIELRARERDATPKGVALIGSTQGIPGVWIVPAAVVDERTTPEWAWFSTHWAPSFDPSAFNDILRHIDDLSSGDETDEYGVLRPTDYAIRSTKEVLFTALIAILGQAARHRKASAFPRGCVATDEEGGLRIEWSKDDRAVHLVVSGTPGGRSYIYHELGEVYGAEDRVAGSVLAYWLQRLFG